MADAALTLAIETSNPSAGGPGEVAVGEVAQGPGGGPSVRLLAVERLAPSGRHDDALSPAIAAVCTAAGVRAASLRRIAVSAGPGGFTALRIAIATAKMIAEVTGAETVAAPTAEVAARGFGGVGRFAVALSSKRGTAWGVVFERSAPGAGAVAGRAGLMDAGLFAAEHARKPLGAIVADEHLEPSILAWAREVGTPVIPPVLRAEAVLAASAGAASVDRLLLAPIYPREPEAVTKWRELGRWRG